MSSPLEPINPVSDSRIEHKTASLNGVKYHYLYGIPKSGSWTQTVFLDAPQVPPNPISLYGIKRAADDIAALAKELNAPRIVLGGHDWYPNLISHIFSVCTPYTAPSDKYLSTADLVSGPLPQFAYQLHLASGEVEKSVNNEQTIRQFLKGMYGARGPNGEVAFDPEKGVLVENLPKIGESKVLNGQVLDYYVKQYLNHGIHPTSNPDPPRNLVNWYRQRRTNWEEDQALLSQKTITQPTLFIQATRDAVLKPEMSKSMDRFIPRLTRKEVVAAHWALIQKPDEVNEIIRQWFEAQGLVGSANANGNLNGSKQRGASHL
ncbi:epoxide hydrolase [Stemphylium lycopersici]|uniref:Epoxide hydrolase n=1 Tax=Stemphylium lycopersici TaxID=183478 RepID=A0A364N4X9_STELY|nr:epoxide hydrolase [Stemphylium lycopersici]RAR11732.1 epoxide hydrolase [Stemphylium lycopersici]